MEPLTACVCAGEAGEGAKPGVAEGGGGMGAVVGNSAAGSLVIHCDSPYKLYADTQWISS